MPPSPDRAPFLKLVDEYCIAHPGIPYLNAWAACADLYPDEFTAICEKRGLSARAQTADDEVQEVKNHSKALCDTANLIKNRDGCSFSEAWETAKRETSHSPSLAMHSASGGGKVQNRAAASRGQQASQEFSKKVALVKNRLGAGCSHGMAFQIAKAENRELFSEMEGEPPVLNRAANPRESAVQTLCERLIAIQKQKGVCFHDAMDACREGYPQLFKTLGLDPSAPDASDDSDNAYLSDNKTGQ